MGYDILEVVQQVLRRGDNHFSGSTSCGLVNIAQDTVGLSLLSS